MFDFRHFSSLIVDRGNLFRMSVTHNIGNDQKRTLYSGCIFQLVSSRPTQGVRNQRERRTPGRQEVDYVTGSSPCLSLHANAVLFRVHYRCALTVKRICCYFSNDSIMFSPCGIVSLANTESALVRRVFPNFCAFILLIRV